MSPLLLPDSNRVSAVLAPVKSEETEAQRSSKARMVRSTRRSTQGITNDVLEEAKRMSAATIAATNHTIPKPSSQQPTETNVSPSETPTTASVPRVELKGQTVTIPHGGLQPAKGRAGFGDPLSNHVVDSRVAWHWRHDISTVDSDEVHHVLRSPPYAPRKGGAGTVSSPSAAPSELQKEFTSAQPTVRTTTAVLRMTSPSVPSSSRATAQLASNHKNDEDLQKPDSAAETSTVSHTATTNITPSVNRGRKTRDRVCTGKVNTSDVLAAASLLEQSSAKTDDSSTIPRPTSRFLRSSVTSTGGPAGGVSNGDRPSPSPSRQISPSPSNGTLLRSGSSVASSPQPQERYTWRDKIDYRRLYEEERNEKERLKRVLEKTNRDLAALQSELARLRTSKSSLLGSYSGGIRDPSPASEIERLRQENAKMSDENKSLVRVISKLSSRT
ncbi:unnamed protein product [Schistocephalus solidus]|uniref:PRKG1_interact domain-containing protein n=1 Tax=Schistocephalus solidus TaxID=70667 RepID=A0A183STI9_SCHSO|nr:unnamed protein product [Schistocephalus solidus]